MKNHEYACKRRSVSACAFKMLNQAPTQLNLPKRIHNKNPKYLTGKELLEKEKGQRKNEGRLMHPSPAREGYLLNS